MLQHGTVHEQTQNTSMSTSHPSPSQAHNPAITISTYRKNTKNTPHKHHLCHLPSVKSPKFKGNRGGNRGKEHAQHHPSPPHRQLHRADKITESSLGNACHYAEHKTSHHCRQMLLHTHTHIHTPPPSLTAFHTTIYLRKPAARIRYGNKSPIHLPNIWCLLTCVSNPFSTELLFLGWSPSPAFSCPLGDLRGIWLEYNGFVTSTLFPNFR